MHKILYAREAYSLDKLLSWVSFAICERHRNLIVLFICRISSKCELTEMLRFKMPNRIEIDLIDHQIRVWNLEYKSDKPDLIIEGAHHGRAVRARSRVVKSRF